MLDKKVYTAIWTPEDDDDEATSYTKQQKWEIKTKSYAIMMDHIDPKLEYVYAHVKESDMLALWNAFEEKYAKPDTHKAVAKRKEITRCQMGERESRWKILLIGSVKNFVN